MSGHRKAGANTCYTRRVIYQPWNALEAPRFTGPRTYARLPYISGHQNPDLTDVEAAVFGMPWDGGASFRGGARMGPEGIRSASGMIRTYNAAQRVQVFGRLSTIDYGDASTVPGYIEETLDRIEEFVRPLVAAGVVPIGMGGDHSVTLAELRALAQRHGPLGLVHFDAHTDLNDLYNDKPYSHGTFLRRALEENVVDPARFIQLGIRGPLYAEEDIEMPASLGVDSLSWIECVDLGFAPLIERIRRRIGEGPAFLTFDIDFVDAGACPGTGTPEVAGPTSFEAMRILRALAPLPFVGFDVVEVSPVYDEPGQVTCLFAANAIFEMLSMLALRKA